jgi:HAAS domain-containing protein
MRLSAPVDARVDSFMARLRAALRGMPEAEIDDILRELRSHISDLAGPQESEIETAIRSLGDPVDLAKKYRAENLIARAECSGSPLAILQGLRHAGRSPVGRFTAAVLYVFGYAIVVTLWRVAIEKVLVPSWAGLWYAPGDPWSFSLDSSGHGAPGTRELLGWWLVPAAIIAGWMIKYLTDRAATWWIRRCRRSIEMETS